MAFHQYSPLFTSGLLSDSSRSPSPTPHPARKSKGELRSFLFLDLAEPSSLKRKDSDATCSTWSGRRIASAHPDPNIYLSIPPSPAGSSRRPSRENSRQLPSPKPAPSVNLPDLPTFPGSGDSLFPHYPTHKPGNHPVSRSKQLPNPPTYSVSSSHALSTRSISVKSEVKRSNRSAALACLEGRTKSQKRISLKRHNFMSMSDDEDEDDSAPAAPIPGVIIANPPKPTPRINIVTSTAAARKPSRTIESWLPPLTNFLDFREDDIPSWRSFIEISTAG